MIAKIHSNAAAGLLLLCLAVAQAAAASQNPARVIGEAYDLENNQFLYREVYCVNDKPDEIEVIYRNEADSVIAHKTLDYRTGAVTPSFVQKNLYSSEVIEVRLRDDEVSMKVVDADTAEPKKASAELADGKLPVVIDAGFDEFVRQNWEALLAGEKKRFLFPFAEHEKLLELRIRSASCGYSSDTDQCFRLELANWFFRMLVAPIELGYDPVERRLLRYRGLSNIGDGKGNGSVVDIRYGYRDLPELACRIDGAPGGDAS